jgi:hypothetical protein
MAAISLLAHFDGKRILLDEPFELEPNTQLIVTVLPKREVDHEAWLRLSAKTLVAAYANDEAEYAVDLIKEANPDYAGR